LLSGSLDHDCLEHVDMTPASQHQPTTAATADDASDTTFQLVVCVVGDERYGIEVGRVHEIIRLVAITALPGAGKAFSGVINLRGRVIPVMELRHLFDLPVADATRLSRIVIADAGGAQIGFVVDAVDEVVRVSPSQVEPTPALAASGATQHVRGIARVDDDLIILLDVEGLVASHVTATDIGQTGASA
jgi:purine-binding chemotaxis protein CheW